MTERPSDRETSRTFCKVGTILRTAENISGLPHWIEPNPLGSTKSRCMSIMMRAVVARGKLNAYGLAFGSESLADEAMLNVLTDETCLKSWV